ncbi:energy transducer TonB [Sphingobium aquiterrae]|uniref:energy transducer TonB n=1 Tax=Sphingobium aquiterrae TaxID=2038656 RepID=UPI00301AD062
MGMTMTPQQGYGADRRSPIGLIGAIAVHGIAVGAILLMPAEVIQRLPGGTLLTYNDPLPPPPPVQPDAKPPEQAKPTPQMADPRPFAPDESIFVNTGAQIFGNGDAQFDLPPLGDSAGTGPGVAPVRDPVLTEAGIDSRFAGNFQPPYPPAMQRLDQEGTVVVRVRIGTDGRVVSIERVSASDDAFWAATQRQALRAWRFRPATRDGVPVESVKTMTVHFRLQA